MNTVALQVLRELARYHNGGSGTPNDFRIAEVSLRLGIPEEDVEGALDTLVHERAVTRHSLGQFTITPAGLHRYRLSQ